MKVRQPHYDFVFGKLCRLLMERGLTMHTPLRGEAYFKRKTGRLHPHVRPSKQKQEGVT